MYDKIHVIPEIMTNDEVKQLLNSTLFLADESKKIYFAETTVNDGIKKTSASDGIRFQIPVYNALERLGIPHTGKVLKRAQLLHYPTGAFNNLHADNCIINPKTGDVTKIKEWTHSAVIYLNEDFEGGEIEYPDLNFKFKPKIGYCVIHPAGAEFLHRVNPVTKGDRYCLVLRLVLPEEDVVVNNAT
jgi:predicted 2-oxoglutarate/Fe(II)-dependent dioxygenase YbiX